jgi:hypothetical protein
MLSMKKMRHGTWILLLAMLGSVPAAMAANYTVTGTIRTPTGPNALSHNVPVKWIKVIAMDEDVLFDDEVGSQHTTGAGTFSISWSDIIENPDVFINVEYLGTGVDGRFIEVRLAQADSDWIMDENIEAKVNNDIPPGTLALGNLNLFSSRANIVTQIGDAVRFLDSQYGTWNMPQNMNVEGRLTNGASYVNGDGSFVSIAFEDWNNPGSTGSAAYSDMHHESFHWIAYRAYGNRWPNFNCACNPHSSNKECCEGFAMQEGSAQYFGSASAVPDNKTGAPAATDWRGVDNDGSDNAGEIVEGALELVWNLNADIPAVLQVLLTDSPDSMREFRDGWFADEGATAASTVSYLDNCAANGIVYTRGRIADFMPGDPPDAVPADTTVGNAKEIDNVVFLRGEIKPTIEEIPRAGIPLAPNSATIPADMKDIGYKPAAAGITDANTAGFTFLGPVAIASDFVWDTTAHTDADYDVIVKLRNTSTREDNFNPDFTGDAAISSNEEWLKRLRTWFNQDANPNNDDEGKVIIDNADPSASNFKPQ